MDIKPPYRSLQFLRWFCRDDYIEEIEGDLVELFEYRAKSTPDKARRQFTWDVLRSFRLRNIKKLNRFQNSNYLTMLQHSILLAFRNFKRYKSSFLINMAGLSTGLACALFIFLWINDELKVDKFHDNNSHLYQVMEQQHNANEIAVTAATPGMLSTTMKENFPEVNHSTNITWKHDLQLSVEENVISAGGYYAGKDFFNVFTFPLIHGDKNKVLADPSGIAISETLARKLFGSLNEATGSVIAIDGDQQFKVTGIFYDVPRRSSLQFDFLLSFDKFRTINPWVERWDANAMNTFVTVQPGTDMASFDEKIIDFVKENEGEQHITLFTANYADRYLYGKYENGQIAGGRISYVKLFTIIASFILFIACINFMNLTTARASRRMKEIGIKKVVGAHRASLIFQHMTEALLLALMAFTLAIILVIVFMPEFNEMTSKSLYIDWSTRLIPQMILIAFITGILAGSYPALYLSGINVLDSIKGKLTNSFFEIMARKGLVIFQFALSVIMIVSVLVVYKQIEYTQTKQLGYNKDQLIRFEVNRNHLDKMETFLTEINQIPGIINASSIGHSLVEGGFSSSSSTVSWEGKDPDAIVEMECVRLNHDMIELLEFEMVDGRSFSRDFGDESHNIIFNQAAIKAMGLKNPVGQTISLWGEKYQIAGVVKDFHYQSFHEQVHPLFMILRPQQTWIVMAKIEAGAEKDVITQLESTYEKVFPGFIFDFRFFDEDYQAQYQAEMTIAKLSRYFAGIAILISCLGLFGLASFTAERKSKEIGIRKIMGSGVSTILIMLAKDFTKMVVASIVVAIPLSYFLLDQWLNDFAFRIDLQWWFFALSGLAALLISWLIVLWQSWKVAHINPIMIIKDE